jgi:hypothetical protein
LSGRLDSEVSVSGITGNASVSLLLLEEVSDSLVDETSIIVLVGELASGGDLELQNGDLLNVVVLDVSDFASKAFWDVNGLLLDLFSVNLHPEAVLDKLGWVSGALNIVDGWILHVRDESLAATEASGSGRLIWGPVEVAVSNLLFGRDSITLEGINVERVPNFAELADSEEFSVWNVGQLAVWSRSLRSANWELLDNIVPVALGTERSPGWVVLLHNASESWVWVVFSVDAGSNKQSGENNQFHLLVLFYKCMKFLTMNLLSNQE